ncbi:glutamate--cysteine ligase [Aestuariivirga litoralis]|uniref:Glutamate--cysteine ligase n=1 Tax=Aestuariivirga litoralis TaxID=2650924 RepID=A0A2W2AK65_9HYPH|nr:glutamate--cysteine ligase [Aestuariivirga litoralis]PZF75895.1 glutamate--cysteine ligase [Aestuariivirga litoralis]
MPIETKAQLIEELASGSKPKAEWKIGTEHEKFPFLTDTLQPVPYHGPRSIKALLDGLKDRYGWTGVYEGENIIALSDPNGLGNVSLEPGGQFELSGAPLDTVHDTCEEVHEHLTQVREVGDRLGIGFLGLGASPLWSLAETPVMPKGRYGIMAPYMDKVGTKGRDMMFRTCTVQVNLDFASEADMVKKLRVSLALQPVATALFADSPFLDGKPNGFLSYRSEVWRDTDNARAGMLPFAFEDGFGFERYVDYALDVPMYFVMRDGKYINTSGESFRAFLDGRLPQLPGEKPVMKDWADHLTTIFPEVRLKKYLEQRGADSGPWRRLCALPALWVGLLYEQSSLDAAWDLVKDWTAEERQKLRDDVPRQALHATIRGRKVQDIAREVLAIARAGLEARGRHGCKGKTEAAFLDPLDEIAQSGKTAAENLLALYNGDWHQDVTRVFRDFAY